MAGEWPCFSKAAMSLQEIALPGEIVDCQKDSVASALGDRNYKKQETIHTIA
eukprot:XP_001708956.1 Hypothetical protein GL50803_39427 [Giardia lamblia ATCC 50803]